MRGSEETGTLTEGQLRVKDITAEEVQTADNENSPCPLSETSATAQGGLSTESHASISTAGTVS